MSFDKTNIPGYVRDSATSAVINRNNHEYEQYMAGRRKALEINTLNDKLKDMGGEMAEMKDLLQQLLNKAT